MKTACLATDPATEPLSQLRSCGHHCGKAMYAQILAKELATEPGESYTALERSVLITSGDWADVGRTALSVYNTVLKMELEKQALPASRGLQYWRQIGLNSFTGVGLCWIQHAPRFASQVFRQSANIKISSTKFKLPHKIPNKANIVSWVESVIFSYKQLFSVFRRPVAEKVDEETERLSAVRKQSSIVIGKLVTECWEPKGSMSDTIIGGVVQMAKAIGLEPSTMTTEHEVLEELQRILDKINVVEPLDKVIPPVWVRYWPMIIAGLFAGAHALGSYQAILNWLQNSLWGTVKLFVTNWVVQPMQQIYYIVRNDPLRNVRLTGQESLESDINSLKRMVVEFMTDKGASSEAIARAANDVAQGNLTPVLQAYEQEMQTPFKSIMSGGLIRSLLIQVQKTKVDAEVALSGIDQIIQQQQLVFGIVAATPALAFLYLLFRSSTGYLSGSLDVKGVIRSEKLVKDRVMADLGSIEERALSKPKLDLEDVGEIYVVSDELRRYTRRTLTSQRHQQFCRDMDRIVGVQDSKFVLDNLLRIYAKY